jgi:hypothetical protein
MTQQLPPKFVQQTRWAYLQDGIEVGPYDANEIVELLSAREIAPDTLLVELNTRRRCPLTEVGPFAQVVMGIVKLDRQQRSERDLLDASREIASGSHRKTILLTLLALVALGTGGAALFIYNPFAPKAEPKGPYQAPETPAQAVDKAVEPAQKSKEPAFAITEMDPAELEVDPHLELINSVLEEKQLNPNAELLGDDDKLEGPAHIDRSKDRRKHPPQPAVAGGPQGQADKGADSGVETMDFSEEEVAMGEGPSGPDDALAVGRMRKVLRKCLERSLHKFPAGEEVLIDARATLQPDGRITGLKLDLMPRKATGEIKMCVSAELMRMRVPAFEGKAVPLSTAVAVPGPTLAE